MRRQTWYPAKLGDKRTHTSFAWLPIKLKNDWRWLEKVTVEWEYREVETFLPPCLPVPKWVRKRFVESRRCPEDY